MMSKQKEFQLMWYEDEPHIAWGEIIILRFVGPDYSMNELYELVDRLNGDYFETANES